MRVLGWVLAGALALTTPIVVQAGSLGSMMRLAEAGPALGIVRVWDGNGPVWHPVPNGWGAGRHQVPGHSRQWNGEWAQQHWGPNRFNGGWVPYGGWGGPYTVWEGPYVPYRSYGDWGALWYPYAEWRGPTGGWGNP